MRWKPLTALAVVAVLAAPQAAQAKDMAKLTYIETIMNIFQLHLRALEYVVANKGPFSDNAVRHAMALDATADFLDHVVPEETGAGPTGEKGGEWPWANHDEYEKLVDDSRLASDRLVVAADRWIGGGDKAKLLTAIEAVKQSCRNCHRELRDWP